MQMPPSETIPTLPDETEPGPVPPIGPGEIEPDPDDDIPLPGEDPRQAPSFPPARRRFPIRRPRFRSRARCASVIGAPGTLGGAFDWPPEGQGDQT